MTYIDDTGRIHDEEQVIVASGGWCAPSATFQQIIEHGIGDHIRAYWTVGPGAMRVLWGQPAYRQQETLL